jgi:hypothetical protein
MPDTPQIFTNVPLVLKGHLDLVQGYLPNSGVVFDEGLSYPSGVAKYRADCAKRKQDAKATGLYIWNRSVLRWSPSGMSRRMVNQTALDNDTGNALSVDTYKFIQGEMDVNFLYVSQNISESQAFEITYLTEQGISGGKELTVVALDSSLGSWNYQVEFAPLSGQLVSLDDVSYMGITGSLKIRGMFLVFNQTSSRILKIAATIEKVNSVIYDVLNILPSEE